MDLTQALIKKLSTMKDDDISRLYMRVFNSDDGALLLQDLRNRSYYYTPTINQEGYNDAHAVGYREGMRSMTGHIEIMLIQPEPQGVVNVDTERTNES